jgi:MFS family permease
VSEGHTAKRGAFSQLFEGGRIVYGMRGLRYYVLAGSLVWLAFGSFGALEPLFFRDVVGTGVQAMGWMNSLFGLGFMTGAALLPRLPRKFISARGLACAVGLTGLGTALYVGIPDLRVIAVGAYFWALVIGIMEPMLRTLMHRDAPHNAVGRVMGTSEVHRRAGEILPLAFAPALAAAFGVQAVLIGGGFIATLLALLSFGEATAIDRLRPPTDDVELKGLRVSDEPISPNP